MTAWSHAYAGKRVLLTGHTGFKGGWLSTWLAKLGATVVGYSLPPSTTPSLFETGCIGQRVHSELGDIRDLDRLEAVWRDAAPDVVFHLAAQALVRRSYADPLETIQTNVLGTSNVLDVARRIGRPVALVMVTSDKCYDNREWVYGYREDDRLGGRDPYSASKAAAEVLAAAYRHSFFPIADLDRHGVSVATARAGNVIGGGDWSPDRIVPDCMRALSRGESISVRNPDATRPWQHVLEPLSGYLTLGARMLQGGAARAMACDSWNFGPDPTETHSVREVVERLIAGYGSGAWHQDGVPGPHESSLLRLSTDKAHAYLSWAPRWNFAKTIDATVEWYRACDRGESMAAWCDRHIDEYVRTAE